MSQETLQAIVREIGEAIKPLDLPQVNQTDIREVFGRLSQVEDALWQLRDGLEREAGYLKLRQIEELLTDMSVEYSLPSIQLLLRVLIQSPDLASEEALKRIMKVRTGLQKLERALRRLGETI